MARPCSVFTAAIGESADAAPATNNDRRQMAKICRNSVSEDASMTAPLVKAKRERVLVCWNDREVAGSPQPQRATANGTVLPCLTASGTVLTLGTLPIQGSEPATAGQTG